MAEALSKSFERPPDDVVDLIKTRIVSQPGWRWPTHVRPTVGGVWCQARHVGSVVSGRLGIDFSDGMRLEFGPGEWRLCAFVAQPESMSS